MATNATSRLRSDLPTAPYKLLAEELDTIGMTQTELAARSGRPAQAINEIVHGKKQITHDTAIELEKVLGIPAHIWVGLEAEYRLALARERESAKLVEQETWLNRFPLKEMQSRNWITSASDRKELVRELLRFLGVASFEAWEKRPVLGFRITAGADLSTEALAVWLRQGEIEAEALGITEYDETRFRETLAEVRHLTREQIQSAAAKVKDLCASTGVAVLFVPELPKSCANGVARWMSDDKALIQLSLRYKTADHLWFTFFHEACHILRHRVKSVHIDGIDHDGADEEEANRFAEDILIPRPEWAKFESAGDLASAAVVDFAAKLGIDAGIVVGRLQNKRLIPFSKLNQLKTRLEWVRADA